MHELAELDSGIGRFVAILGAFFWTAVAMTSYDFQVWPNESMDVMVGQAVHVQINCNASVPATMPPNMSMWMCSTYADMVFG
mmetsp:Transcript_45792/g.107047  ORF Transcript_45792/g.107047 Transcript_45792/m.107047 type:complete len:82 (-) Transcript_45792:47-292(-)